MGDRSRNSRLVAVILLMLFVLAGVARLNSFCLLEPDSPDYLFTSRALARFDGYREIDLPGEPLHTFRPPGLPLLLAPLSWASPYNVPLAKALILTTAFLALVFVWSYARELCGERTASLALLLIATSPYSLLFASEVMSEFPYIACLFAILLLLRRAMRSEGWLGVAPVALLLALLPFIRTIGLVWIAAIGLWGLCRRSRWKWSVAAALGLAPTLLWSWRNGSAGGPTYLGAIMRDFSGAKYPEIIDSISSGAWYYLQAFIDLLLPALEPGRPLYERVLLTPAPDLGGLFGLAALLVPAFVFLFLLGAWMRRKEEGGLIALQTLLLFAALAIYPPRHERLVWPLLPLAWLYAIAGTRLAVSWLVRTQTAAKALALLFAGVLVAWQCVACSEMVSANLSWLRLGDRFYSELAPPMYFSDWQAAGHWINRSAPPEARILTRHSDVGFTARRYQDSLRFEELSPAAWRRRISQFRARYLVVPTTLCGRMFPLHLLDSDSVYRYEMVYEARDVAVLEVIPNRTGYVDFESSWLSEALEECREISSRHPERFDLTRRVAELLTSAGRPEEAEDVLRKALSAGTDDAGLHLSLGMVLEVQERYNEALEELTIAGSMPKAALLRKRLDRGVERTRAAIATRKSEEGRARALVESARWNMSILDYARAREDADRALELAPGNPAVMALHADLLRAVGRESMIDEAREAYRAAARSGDRRAAAALEMMELERAVLLQPHPEEAALIRLAMQAAGEGRPGRALTELETARRIYPASRAIRRRLADLYLFYGLVSESAALYRELLQGDRGDENARRGLQQSLEAEKLPSF